MKPHGTEVDKYPDPHIVFMFIARGPPPSNINTLKYHLGDRNMLVNRVQTTITISISGHYSVVSPGKQTSHKNFFTLHHVKDQC